MTEIRSILCIPHVLYILRERVNLNILSPPPLHPHTNLNTFPEDNGCDYN